MRKIKAEESRLFLSVGQAALERCRATAAEEGPSQQRRFPDEEIHEMKLNSALRLKHVAWASAGVLVVVLILFAARSGAKPTTQAPPPPVVEVAPVEQKDIPVYREWIGTLSGQVNADIKAQVTGYLLTKNYKEGSYVTKGQLLFEIDPRPFQATLDQAKGQLAQAEAQLVQEEARLATAEANQLKSQLDVEKYGPLAKADAVSKQDFNNATQTDLANQAQVQAAEAAIVSVKAQTQANQAAVETASINLGFTRVVSPIDGIGVAQAQVGNLVSASRESLTTVSTLDPIRDYFTVSEQSISRCKAAFSFGKGSLEVETHSCRRNYIPAGRRILFCGSSGKSEHRRNPARCPVSKSR